MKALAINGSPRHGGNTAILLRHVCEELENSGIATETFQLGGKKAAGCIACYKCFEAKNKRCAVTDDVVNDCIARMDEADAIIIGSPTYFADCTASTKALMERAGFVARANGDLFKRIELIDLNQSALGSNFNPADFDQNGNNITRRYYGKFPATASLTKCKRAQTPTTTLSRLRCAPRTGTAWCRSFTTPGRTRSISELRRRSAGQHQPERRLRQQRFRQSP